MAKSSKSSSKKNPFADLPIVNPHQLGGIETSVLDNGPGAGVRIAWVNTGTGLRYKVVIDRGLDIMDAEYMGQSLTWHGLGGVTAPSHSYNRSMEWLRGFHGGLLVSCGPLNTGAPFEEDGLDYGIHGTHSHSRAIVESIINPDPSVGRLAMSITAIIRTARMFGPNIELRRTIRSTLGEPAIHVDDEFVNRGNQPAPHAWLLHINFGYPLLEPGASTYCYKGKITPRSDSVEWFTQREDYRAAPAPQKKHRGTGEVFTYIDPKPAGKSDDKKNVDCGLVNTKRGFGVQVSYPRKDYDRLGNWQHWGPGGSYTGALEPMTAGVEGRPVDRERGWFRCLEPGERSRHRCNLSVVTTKSDLDRLLKLNR